MTTLTRLSELTGDYVVDAARTRIGFAVRLMMAGTVAGQFDELEGSVHLDGGDPSKSSAQLTIQAASIQTRNERRDDHLRSRFLDAGRHPAITFSSARVEQADETTFTVTGGLTIRGVTKPVTVDLELTAAEHDPRGSFRVGFAGRATLRRKDWGVSWNPALEGGGALVGDKVNLELSIVAVRPS